MTVKVIGAVRSAGLPPFSRQGWKPARAETALRVRFTTAQRRRRMLKNSRFRVTTRKFADHLEHWPTDRELR
jgi:hypothetical protein